MLIYEWHPDIMTDEEIASLKIGDVIVSKKSGMLRVVRELSGYGAISMRSVSVTIQRCSWTHRPYTIIDRFMLRRDYECTGTNVGVLNSPLDMAMKYEINSRKKPKITCCMVKGIA